MKTEKTLKSGRSAAESLLALISFAAVMGLIALPSGAREKTALFSAYAAFPQGGYALLRSYMDVLGEIDAEDERPPGPPVRSGLKTAVSDDITETPPDILVLMEEAEKKAPSERKDGDITGKTYGRTSATSVFGNVLVRNMTSTKSMNIEKVLNEDMGLVIRDKTKPGVLIFHTHTTEGYETLDRGWYASDTSSRSTDPNKNVVRVGREIAARLELAGFTVIHDETIHDLVYSGSYDRSRRTIQKYLDEYPELQVVLDVHRDSIQENNGTKIKPVAEINGKKAAQIMLLTGAEEGSVKDFPNWQYNLRFALRLQKACEDTAPGLMRPVYFCQRKYNLDMTKYSLLLEMGSEANTLEEAAYAGRLIGRALAQLLEECVT
ncbi:MAG: stage II sporulation protein P [Oscillospiraceae bacterium]|nr:stage II sporulation protein P [Oscillospiraceae bacterium]